MKKLSKVIGAMPAYLYLLAVQVSAAGQQAGSGSAFDAGDFAGKAGNDAADTIMTKIAGFVKPIAAILIFGSVLMVGFEIIMKRNKADDRMASMSSLMWVGIGTLVIAFAALIASFIFDGVTA